MGSIQKGFDKAADISRFFVVEVEKASQTIEEYENMVERIKYFAKNKDRIFTRAVLNAQSIRKSFKVAQRYFKTKRIEARQSDQFAALLACFWIYFSTEVITEIEVENLTTQFELLKSDYATDNDTNDGEECYDSLMSMKVDNMNNSVYYCIGQIQYSINTDEWDKILGAMGIRYYPKTKELLIAQRSPEIKKRLPGLSDYHSLLKRSSRFVREDRQRIPNYNSNPRAIVIRVTL